MRSTTAAMQLAEANDQAGVVHRRGRLVELMLKEGPAGLRRLGLAFEKIVEDSYTTHPMRKRTQAEDKARAHVVVETFRTLQGDLAWSSDRCLSLLRTALAAHLDKKGWAPATKHKTLWVPDGTLFDVKDPALDPAGD